MQQAIRQFSIFIVAFFLIWFALSRINYLVNDKIQTLSSKNEKNLGDLFLQQLFKSYNKIENDSITGIINEIKNHIKNNNECDTAAISLYVIRNEEINAFTFPGRNIVIQSGLIEYCKSPEELASVIAHEMGHIEKDHVMKKLTKEVGISLLTALISNNNNGEMIGEMAQMISSNYYSRDLESEADASAIDLLANAGVDPSTLANFLYRFSNDFKDIPKELEWVSTHPIAKERAAEILVLSKDRSFEPSEIIDSVAWAYVKKEIQPE